MNTTDSHNIEPSRKRTTWARPILAALLVSLLVLPLILNDSASAAQGGSISGKIDAKKKYLADAIVYLKDAPAPSKPPSKHAKMDQRGHKFIPHVLPIVKGTTVDFHNSDDTGHNVFSPDHETYDLGTWKKGEVRSYTFKREGAYTQLCKLHPSMLAYVVSLPNGYFAKSDAHGNFKIENVPPGTYTLEVWHERRGAAPQKVTVAAGKSSSVSIKLKKKRR